MLDHEFSKHTTERWALSGTTVEKKLKDFGAQYRWANPGKSLSAASDGGEVRQGVDQLSGEPHVLGEDKVRQFREGVDEGLYQLGADDANLPGQTDVEHKVELDPEHKEALQQARRQHQPVRAEAKERGLKGISGIDADRMMKQGLYEKPGNAIVKELADADRRVGGVRLRRRGGRRRERRQLRAEAHRLLAVRQAARPRRRASSRRATRRCSTPTAA
jgi:hypothetical protein